MSVLNATAAKGLAVYNGTTSLYTTHDNASDNFVAGVYSHNPLEASATEFDLVVSFLLFLIAYYGQVPQDIPATQTLVVQAGAGMIIPEELIVDGDVQVDGELVIL